MHTEYANKTQRESLARQGIEHYKKVQEKRMMESTDEAEKERIKA